MLTEQFDMRFALIRSFSSKSKIASYLFNCNVRMRGEILLIESNSVVTAMALARQSEHLANKVFTIDFTRKLGIEAIEIRSYGVLTCSTSVSLSRARVIGRQLKQNRAMNKIDPVTSALILSLPEKLRQYKAKISSESSRLETEVEKTDTTKESDV